MGGGIFFTMGNDLHLASGLGEKLVVIGTSFFGSGF